jgi:DNA-directed RNA polymerase subunit RPC12/RpoP
MTISSRTPEGDPNKCPICGHRVRLEPSIDTRDAPCPSCGHLLWFDEIEPRSKARARDMDGIAIEINLTEERMAEMVIKYAKERLGPVPKEIERELSDIPTSKFAKVDWNSLLTSTNWTEVLALAKSAPD